MVKLDAVRTPCTVQGPFSPAHSLTVTGVCPRPGVTIPLCPEGVSQGQVGSWGAQSSSPLAAHHPCPWTCSKPPAPGCSEASGPAAEGGPFSGCPSPHQTPFPQSHLCPALGSPSAPHCTIQPCRDFPTTRDKYHSKIFFQVGMGGLQQCITDTSQFTGVYCLG